MHIVRVLIFLFIASTLCWAQEELQWQGLSKFAKADMVQVLTKNATVVGTGKKGVFVKGRKVVLHPFQMGKYLVTQQLYKAVMSDESDIFDAEPSVFKENPDENENQDLRPVDNINWYDAVYFCNKLSMLEGLEPVYEINILGTKDNHINEAEVKLNPKWHDLSGYRLPTEAEWEFAARGSDTKDVAWNFVYSGGDTTDDVMWYYGNANEKTHEVGLKLPNSLGIYDMSGNLKEWCSDLFQKLSKGRDVNPIGALSSPCYVLRGGSWSDNAQYCNITRRENDKPSRTNKYYGFRIARSGINQ